MTRLKTRLHRLSPRVTRKPSHMRMRNWPKKVKSSCTWMALSESQNSATHRAVTIRRFTSAAVRLVFLLFGIKKSCLNRFMGLPVIPSYQKTIGNSVHQKPFSPRRDIFRSVLHIRPFSENLRARIRIIC